MSIKNWKVILLGLDINGLTVCRSLGKKGITMVGLTENAGAIGTYSKYLEEVYVVNFEEKNLLSFLLSNKLQFSRKPLIFPTTDQTVEFLAKNKSKLQQKYETGVNDPYLTIQLLDKKSFKEIANSCGLKTANSKVFCRGEFPDLSEFKTYPLIVKACKKVYGVDDKDRLPKAIIVDNERDAKGWIENYLKSIDQCIVEEYISGEDSNVYFVLVCIGKNSNIDLKYCGQKIRQWPIQTGGTASARRFNDDKLFSMTIEFFQKIDYVGLASMEYKYDALRNEYFAIEPTVGRIDFQSGLAIANGYNFPHCFYLNTMNLGNYCFRKKMLEKEWICFDADYNAINKMSGKKNIKFIMWMLSLIWRKSYSVFDVYDMAPFVAWFRRRFL